MLVREENGVDRQQIRGGDRRAGQLDGARSPAELVFLPGRVERRIREKAPTVELDQHRRPTDVGDPHVGHGVFATAGLEWSTAHERT